VVDGPLLTIGQVAEQTGLSEPTLRAWERRFGYPAPVRDPGGRRRYPADQVEQLWEVNRSRKAGLSLEAAISRVSETPSLQPATIFAALSGQPGVAPLRIRKRELLRVVRGLEDELMASGSRALVFAGFQRERFYRQSRERYREMARFAYLTVARADFDSARGAGGVLEVPLDCDEPSSNEWSFVCDGPGVSLALAAWETALEQPEPDSRRCFELLWSADPATVRRAARAAVELAAPRMPEVAVKAAPLLEGEPPPEGEGYRRLAGMANRVLGYLVRADRPAA
jgi:DNA-binding transcriptional MerR regulator